MRIIDWVMLACLAGCVGWAIGHGMVFAQWQRRTEDDAANLYRGKTAHEKVIRSLQIDFKRFTSPEAINDDMEIVADLIETRQADRLSMPRPDAGPPAIIHQTKRDDVYPVNRWLRKR